MYEFKYHRPGTVRQAANLLVKNEDAKVIAGGHTLIPVMKLRIARPSVVVDISRLELRGVEERDGAVHIGALTTWAELADVELPAGLEAIPECAREIGDDQPLGAVGDAGQRQHAARDEQLGGRFDLQVHAAPRGRRTCGGTAACHGPRALPLIP